MASISMRSILVIFLAAVGCQSDNPGASSPWAKLQISPDTLSSMVYGNFLIEIYEHANNPKATTSTSEKRYFYSPIALLDYKSAASFYNNVTKQPEMRFSIEMWNDKVQNEVVKHLNDIVGHEVKSNKVAVIPFEKVILTSKRPTADYSLDPEWTNYDKSKTLRLSLSCSEQKICDELASEMRSDPEQFDHFKLLYSLSSQKSQTKQTTITIDSITSGRMVLTLLQKFKNKKEIFLTVSDEKKMLTETATNIRMDTFDDYEVLSPDTEFQILNILKDLLVTSRTTIKEECDKKWVSVFWHEDNYRPDKTTKTLNEIINKLDTETQKKLADMFQKAEKQSEIIKLLTSNDEDEETNQNEEEFRPVSQSENANENEMRRSQTTQSNCKKTNASKDKIQHNYNSNSWADLDRISSIISGKMSNDSASSSQFKISEEDVEKLLQESRNHVEWDGEKFVPKPIQLSRINLAKFRDSQSFQDRNFRVRYTTAELSALIKVMERGRLTVTDDWNNLKDELKDTKELLRTTVMNLDKKTTELANTRIDLTDLTNKLEGTQQDLVKIKIEFEKKGTNLRKTVDDLSVVLNANSQRFGYELKTAEDNLRKLLGASSNDLETAKTNLASTRTELSNTKSAVADLTTKLNARTSEIVDIGKMPTSCYDLERMGHKLSGFFLVKGLKKMEMIYCDFYPNQNDKQKWIGYADIKSAPVHFYVQRNSSFNHTYETQSNPIPFDLARVNEGNAMNLSSGIFTAPRPGIYFFSFAGVARLKAKFACAFSTRLYLNGNQIGISYTDQGDQTGPSNNEPVNQVSPITLQSTLDLKKGDRVWVTYDVMYLTTRGSCYLYDNRYHLTHFTGFVLEEEIVATL